MRLLNLWTLEFKEFFDAQIPPYAILSHKWGEHEITYKDLLKGRNLSGPGYDKVLGFCDLARERTGHIPDATDINVQEVRVDWGWVDTCCIDKRSSAELSEAINSMFKWYHSAAVCYVFLGDVENKEEPDLEAYQASDWFKRGWTLQELLAPWDVVFCDSDWQILGHKCTHRDGGRPLTACEQIFGPGLNDILTSVTGIDRRFLKGPLYVYDASVACRMSWAANRRTSRTEDIAYCLLGIFGVNMPLMYGEGQKAFYRLQEEIIRSSNDQSVLGWNNHYAGESVFASHPAQFAGCGNVDFDPTLPTGACQITNRGLELRVIAKKVRSKRTEVLHYVFDLNCHYSRRSRQSSGDNERIPKRLWVSNDGQLHSDQYVIRRWNNSSVAGWEHDPSPQFEELPLPAEEVTLYIKLKDYWHNTAVGGPGWVVI